MNKIITKSWAADNGSFTLNEAVNDKINSASDLVRTNAIILIGLNLNDSYTFYSQLLLNELNREIHFENVRLGVKSAWSLAVVLAENLKSSDNSKLKKNFDKWPKEEQEGLLN